MAKREICMRIQEITDRSEVLVERLTAVWEDSVRASHFFLSDMEIDKIKAEIPSALQTVEHLVVAVNDITVPEAFMGIENKKLEMLFISAAYRRQGWGRQLLLYGITVFGINKVAVNEQNPQALAFYERMGFIGCRRLLHDEQGRPYPLLCMRRADMREHG